MTINDAFSMGSLLFGTQRTEDNSTESKTTTIYGTATSDSKDGVVNVFINDNVLGEGEDYDDDGNRIADAIGDTSIELDTSVSVKEGDTVMISLIGGIAKTPIVTGNVGEGDRQDVAIARADKKADDASIKAGEAIGTASDAKATAQEATSKANDAVLKIQAVEASATQALNSANEAKELIKESSDTIRPILDEFDSVKENASKAANDLETIETSLAYEYAKKTDLTEVEATLRSEVTQSASGWIASVYYTAKGAAVTDEAHALIDKAKKDLDDAQGYLNDSIMSLDKAEKEYVKVSSSVNDAIDSLEMANEFQVEAQRTLAESIEKLEEARAILAEAEIYGDTEAIEAAQLLVNEATLYVEQSNSVLDEATESVHVAEQKLEEARGKFDIAESAVAKAKSDYDQALIDYNRASNGFSETCRSTMSLTSNEFKILIDRASRSATDYLRFSDGILEIANVSDNDSTLKMHLTNSQLSFVDGESNSMADFGKNQDNLWVMNISNANVKDMMTFGSFAWVKRDNGNMSLKWIG